MPLYVYTMKDHSTQYSVHTRFHLKRFYRLKIAWNKEILPPLIFNLALGYAIRRVHVYHENLILKGTYQLVFNADNVIVLGGRVYTLYKEKHGGCSSR